MKSSVLKRALCLACCMTLTLGAFAYRPPEAKAVFASPAVALGASLLASVVVGTTATFFVESGAADTIGMAIDGLVREFVSTTADLAEYTSDMFFEEIPNGLVLLQDGTIQLSAAAGNLTARFINWLREEGGLEESGESLTFGESLDGFISVGGYTVPALPDVDTSKYPYLYIYKTPYSAASGNVVFRFYASSQPVYWYSENSAYPGSYDFHVLNSYTPYVWYWCNIGDATWTFGSESADRAQDMGLGVPVYANTAIYEFENQSVLWTDVIPASPSYIEGTEVSLQPKSEFQEIPNVIPEGQFLSIDTGLSALPQDDPQAIADAIMGAINAGTLYPSIAIGHEAVDTPEEGTDEDDVIVVPGTDADLLDWTKYIGQKVASIPQAIGQSVAKAVASAFAPDPILVNEITGAFSSKFGFVGTLKQVGDDLFAMDAGTEPPVVWIHLEDAEGRYNYGGAVKALDMSWYQRYKPDVDRIFGGFLWIAYLWLLFKRLPDIINGAGMAAADSLYVGEFEMISGEKIAARRSKRL